MPPGASTTLEVCCKHHQYDCVAHCDKRQKNRSGSPWVHQDTRAIRAPMKARATVVRGTDCRGGPPPASQVLRFCAQACTTEAHNSRR
eukprot:15469783-Alexandrium_andersonii.AAC.1